MSTPSRKNKGRRKKEPYKTGRSKGNFSNSKNRKVIAMFREIVNDLIQWEQSEGQYDVPESILALTRLCDAGNSVTRSGVLDPYISRLLSKLHAFQDSYEGRGEYSGDIGAMGSAIGRLKTVLKKEGLWEE